MHCSPLYIMTKKMANSSSILPIAFAVLFLLSSISTPMAENLDKSGEAVAAAAGEVPAVHIVHVARPEGEEAEAFHIRVLASVLGSEEAAKEALIYHYTHAASGFSARLTPKQVADLQEHPGVFLVVPDTVVQLH